jgi:hypothetical protein
MSNEVNFSIVKYRNDFLFAEILGYSYCSFSPYTIESFHIGPFGLNYPLYTTENYSILGSLSFHLRSIFVESENISDMIEEKIYFSSSFGLTFDATLFTIDVGYGLNKKNMEISVTDYWADYSLKIPNPYNGFFIRLGVGLQVFESEKVFAGKKRINLPNPRLKIRYNSNYEFIEAGKEEIISVKLINKGKGYAENVYLNVSNKQNTNLLVSNESHCIGNLSPKSEKTISIPIEFSEKIFEKQIFNINLSIKEKDGFSASKNFKLKVIPLKPIFPPSLYISDNSIIFYDENKNNVLEASESGVLKFKLKNKGQGDAIGLEIKTKQHNCEGIKMESVKNIGTLESGKEIDIAIPISSNYNTIDGKCSLLINIEDANKFSAKEISIEFPTSKFNPPNLLVTDYVVSTTSKDLPRIGEPINIKFSVQNIGQSIAKDVFIECVTPENIFFSSSKNFSFNQINPNEVKVLNVEFFASRDYTNETIPITFVLKESFGKYSQNKTTSLILNNKVSTSKFIFEGQTSEQNITVTGLRSDVDVNIPINNVFSQNTYALIIGNEDYSARQINSDKEIDVAFAINDAQIFKQYLVKTYGVPEKNINLILNGTTSEIRQGIDKLSKIASLVGDKSSFIIYYAGHGISDNIGREPFIIPVDVNASNLEYAIKLFDILNIFHKNTVKDATIILDACFSGLGRNKSLIDTRGVRVRPKYSIIPKNTIILSASSEIEPSHPYYEQNHGLFTYYLLKGIKESNGDINLKNLFEQLQDNVALKSILLKNQKQTPTIIYDINLKEALEERKLVE